jgi:TM2 domain-containing membrane protein YozV
MIRKKNSFFTFCFSLLPGAGQMYMGFMKRGISLMSMFFALIFLTGVLRADSILFAMPIIWFFAFFDTHNLRSMLDDEFYAMKDDYILIPDFAKEKVRTIQSKYRNVLAIALIVIGASILWNNIFEFISITMPEEVRYAFYRFGDTFPQIIIGSAIIVLGVYLIRGKKKELDSADKFNLLEDKGGL